MKQIHYLASAKDDLRNGFYFYESQKSGLGTFFLDSIFSDIDSLQIFPNVHPIYYKNYHRLLSKRFPYAIYYKINSNQINVYAVVDCRRNPNWLRKRM